MLTQIPIGAKVRFRKPHHIERIGHVVAFIPAQVVPSSIPFFTSPDAPAPSSVHFKLSHATKRDRFVVRVPRYRKSVIGGQLKPIYFAVRAEQMEVIE